MFYYLVSWTQDVLLLWEVAVPGLEQITRKLEGSRMKYDAREESNGSSTCKDTIKQS